MPKINVKQRAKIFAVAKELDIDNELLHTFIKNIVGVDSIAKLTSFQAAKVIDELEYKKTGIRKETQYRSNMATEDQLYKIHALEKALGWDNNPRRLKAFMKKYCRVDNEKWLTFDKASNLIEALKKVLEKEEEKNS